MIKIMCILTASMCLGSCENKEPVPVAPVDPESGLTATNNRYAGDSPEYVHPGYYETTKATDKDSSLVGYAMSAVPVNTAILTEGNQQYVAFYNGDHRMVLAQRTLVEAAKQNGPWRYCVLDELVPWDTHNYITMTKDKFGCLLVSGNMHDDPLVFFATDESGDIRTVRRVRSLYDSSKEQSVTYPKFLYLKDGRLLFHYRDGRSGSGNEVYLAQNPDESWSPYLDTPLIDGKIGGYDMSAYMTGPTLGPDGNYHLVWVWRDTYQAETCHDLSYAYSPDLINWYGPDQQKVDLPMNYTQKSLIVDPIPVKGGINNACIAQGFDAQGRPMISYFKFDNYKGTGQTQVYVARLENKKWKIYQLTKFTDWRWYFEGGGTLIKQMTVGEPVLESDGQITVRYRRYNPDGTKIDGMECWLNGQTLSVNKTVTERSTTADIPSWAKKITTQYSGEGVLKINYCYDINGAKYILRWESLVNNRDLRPTVEIPQPTELRVVKTL